MPLTLTTESRKSGVVRFLAAAAVCSRRPTISGANVLTKVWISAESGNSSAATGKPATFPLPATAPSQQVTPVNRPA